MPSIEAALVEIVREFLWAHQLARRLFARYRSGELRFAELAELVGDEEGSVLFRLKERCHALFRPGDGGARVAMRREALFDLAVGSLFHEAMSFRENFYQREVYGPRVRALRSEAAGDSDALFQEFEKVLATANGRLETGVQEVEALLDQTREQLTVLLVEHRSNGHLARFLIEQAPLIEEVFGEDLEALLGRIHGMPAAGYDLAGRSYLASGYYEDAERAFGASIARGGDPEKLTPLCDFARGMTTYLSGDYAESIDALERWLDGSHNPAAALVSLARATVSRIRKFAEADERGDLEAQAAALLTPLGGAER